MQGYANTGFNARKAAQVVAYLALKAPARSLPVIKAVKLVYLSDRDSIKTWGFPILDEPHVSMPHGPVNGTTYSHICGEYDLAGCGWSEFLDDRADHMIAACDGVSVDALDELSEADMQCLDRTWARFGWMDKWALRDWTHDRKNVPEWEDPHGSSRPIPLERIMTMVGIQNVDERAALVNDHREIDGVFAQLRR
jgi:uncharacterized phage-associated protein